MVSENQLPDKQFEVLPAYEMRRKYGLYAENRPVIKLDPNCVPQPLRKLIPLAEKIGIADDLIREDFFAKTPQADLAQLTDNLMTGWRGRRRLAQRILPNGSPSARCGWELIS